MALKFCVMGGGLWLVLWGTTILADAPKNKNGDALKDKNGNSQKSDY